MLTDSSIYNTLKKVLNKTDTAPSQYCYMRNAQGKEWIIDVESIKSAQLGLNIYEPQSPKGKLIKKALPYIQPILEIKSLFGIKRVSLKIASNFEEELKSLFNSKDIHCSFFLGTPSVHQKIVVQIDNGENILGYVKLTDNDKVKESFDREYGFLNWIRSKGINNVPIPLLCEIEETGIFIQTSQKDTRAFSKVDINDTLVNFLREMHDKTKICVLFENTDYYKLLQGYSNVLTYYPEDNTRLAQQIESILGDYEGKVVEFSAYHGDFTPWNTFYNPDGSFHVFDFEYAVKTYPPMLDMYHWYVSDCIYRLHLDAEEIYQKYKKCNLHKYDNKADENMKLYLASQIIFYLRRENGDLKGDVLKNMVTWGKLLEYF